MRLASLPVGVVIVDCSLVEDQFIGDKINPQSIPPVPAVNRRLFFMHTSTMSNNEQQPHTVPEDDDEPDEW